jgi:hypothetical protein
MAQIIEKFGVVWAEDDGLATSGNGLVGLIRRPQGMGEIAVGWRIIGFDRDSLSDQIHCDVTAARLKRNHPQMV